MASDKIDTLIRDIAAAHNVAVQRDDPIMVLYTVNEHLLRDSAAAQERALTTFREEMEAVSLRWGDDAKGKAEAMLTAALEASREAMKRELQAATESHVATVHQELLAAQEKFAGYMLDARKTAYINIIAACITVAAVLGLLLVMMVSG